MPHVDLDPTVEYPQYGWPAAILYTSWNEKPLVQQIPGARYDSKYSVRSRWLVPLTWASYVQVRGIFPSATYSDSYVEWVHNTFGEYVSPARALRTLTSFDVATFDARLRPYQNATVAWGLLVHSGILGNEMGLGKTVELLSILARLESSLPVLLACPNSMKEHWARHVRAWFPAATPYVVEGPAAKRAKIIDEAKKDSTAFVIINLESARLFSRLAPYGNVKLERCRECDPRFGNPSLTPSRCHVHPKPLNGFGFRTVAVDEIHRIAAPKSQMSRAMWALAHDPSVVYRWGTTGTFIRNNPLDGWSPMHFVAPDEYPTRSAFGDRYALLGFNPHGGTDVLGLRPDTRDELFSFFDLRYRRMLKALVAQQLPPKVYAARYVDLKPGQRKMYDQLAEYMTTQDENGEMIVTTDNLTARTRKAQLSVASLTVVDKPDPDDPKTWKMALCEPSPVLDELEAVMDELGDEQFVVAAVHKQLINLASRRLANRGIDHALITGDVTPVERDRGLQALRDRKVRTLLFTVQAGGTGLDMSCAPNIIFIQRPDSMIDYVQAEDRVHRIGSEVHDSVNVIHIIARNTVEFDKAENIQEKMRRLEEINRDRALLEAGQAHADTLLALETEQQQIMNSWTTDAPTGREE